MDKFVSSRKFRLLLACISLIILMDLIQDTYAKYVSSADATSDFTIARWAFTVNNQDIIANNDFSTTIVPTIDANPNISSGVIAPTSTGYFDIIVDSSNVGVAFDQTISLDHSSDNTVTDLVFTGYKINDGTIVSLNGTNTITTTHALGEVNTNNRYRFYIEWKDGTGETMDNENDTDASIDGVAAVNVSINFIQKASNS